MSTKQQQSKQFSKDRAAYNRLAKKLRLQILTALGKRIKVTFRDLWKAGKHREDYPDWELDLIPSRRAAGCSVYIDADATIKPTSTGRYPFSYKIDGGATIQTRAGKAYNEGRITQTFRARKDGTFNIDKIVDQLVKGVDRINAENHIAASKKKAADQKAIRRRESEHTKIQEVGLGLDNAKVERDVDSGAYTLTISELNAEQAKTILEVVQA